MIGKDGKGKATLSSTHVNLGSGEDSLMHAGGTALVIHAKKDDQKSNPAGAAGDRVACGVIQASTK